MSTKSVLTALGLITLGILFGVVLISGFRGEVDPGYASVSGEDVKLGGTAPLPALSPDAQGLNGAFTAVARAVTPSVVSITVTTSGGGRSRNMPRDFFHFFGPEFRTPDPEPSQGAGSGVIITPDGYIITNNHVVEGAAKDGIEVILNDKSRIRASLIGSDPTTDLAVIRIEGRDLPVAALGNSDEVQVGEWVLAIGNPLGLNSTVTAGIVSALGRNIRIIADSYGIESFIQTDAAINPGNSGGALVNLRGEVVGINTAIATTNARYQGYGFAVPVNLARRVASDLIREGKVRRGYIGVQIQAVDQTIAGALGMEKAEGVFIQGLVEGGAGERAGLREQDVILSVDGRTVNEANELQSYIAQRRLGDIVTLKIFREGKSLEKRVTLRAREDSEAVAAAEGDREEGEEPGNTETSLMLEELGMGVRSLTPEEKRRLEVPGGAAVESVKPYGEAFNRGMAAGDVILEADRKDVRSADDLRRIVEGRKKGDSMLLRVRRQAGGTTYVAVQIPR